MSEFEKKNLTKIIVIMQKIMRIMLLLILLCQLRVIYAQSPAKLQDTDQRIKVIELRDYLMKPGQRNAFINYFEENFIESQNSLGAHILGQYRVKGAFDNFMWFRGFKDMASRSKFLNDFYYGPFWKSHRNVPNSLLLNNDNVYLLKPLTMRDSMDQANFSADPNWFGAKKGIAVIDFYISNTKLPKLIEFVRQKYKAVLDTAGVTNTSFWISETIPNDFTGLPVFQDKNLLVQITFYSNEEAYQKKLKLIESSMNSSLKTDMADLVTLKNTLVLYPTAKSFTLSK